MAADRPPTTPPGRTPPGYTAVTPWVITQDTAGLLDFVRKAFDAEELARLPGPDGHGIVHAEFRIGDAVVMAFDSGQGWPATPAFLRLYVDDADATHERALAAGATPVTRVTYLFWGDRVGRVRDPFGNVWWTQSHVEDVNPAEIERRMADRKFADAMAYVQSSLHEAMTGEVS